MTLAFAERPAAGTPDGLLVLHHGRGSDERDLLGLADALDPERRLHVVTPRAPLSFAGSPGYYWYIKRRVGYPAPETFTSAQQALAAFQDALWARTGLGPEATILGGFSMGTVMSYALGLDGDRPAPAGILAFSGFIPTVAGWEPAPRPGLPVFITHGRRDPMIDIDFALRAREVLEAGGSAVSFQESDAGHTIGPDQVAAARTWLAGVLAGQASGGVAGSS